MKMSPCPKLPLLCLCRSGTTPGRRQKEVRVREGRSNIHPVSHGIDQRSKFDFTCLVLVTVTVPVPRTCDTRGLTHRHLCKRFRNCQRRLICVKGLQVPKEPVSKLSSVRDRLFIILAPVCGRIQSDFSPQRFENEEGASDWVTGECRVVSYRPFDLEPKLAF